MVITGEQSYHAVAPLLKLESADERKQRCQMFVKSRMGDDGFYGMTVGVFARIVDAKDVSAIIEHTSELEMTVSEWYVLQGLRDFIEDYSKKLEALTPKPTTEEKKAANVCMKQTVAEGLLIFAREYFALHSFREAEQVTLGEILIAKKDVYNKTSFQRAYNSIVAKK